MAEQNRRLPAEDITGLLRIDHVTIAGTDLPALRRALADAGLETDYGGLHSNGLTHMALLGFPDGSYLELIAAARPGTRAPWWPDHIAQDGGPCAWSLRSEDVAADAGAFRARGVPVRGPITMQRTRPDGRQTEFTVAFLGAGEPGSVLPFLIQDRTPRDLRVEPSRSAVAAGITGVAGVRIGLRDLEAGASLFRRAFGWPAPVPSEGSVTDEVEAHFPGTPVTLIAPRTGDSPLARRVARLGEGPVAFLLRARTPRGPQLAALGLHLVEERRA